MKYSGHNPKQLPPLDYLKECFSYDSETGTLTWNVRPLVHFKTPKSCATWNKRFSGKEAGTAHSAGYISVAVQDSLYLAHRLAYYMGTGVAPDQIDHINGVRADNRLCNLRSTCQTENMRNAKKYNTNTSGVTGVSYDKAKGKWHSYLSQESLGVFTDKIDAIYARYWAEQDAGYHENHGRV